MNPAELKRRLDELEPLCVPRLPGAQDLRAQNARIERLRLLYEADGRDNPDHPLHGTFTGLHQQTLQPAPF